jgi:hypothetical protein
MICIDTVDRVNRSLSVLAFVSEAFAGAQEHFSSLARQGAAELIDMASAEIADAITVQRQGA